MAVHHLSGLVFAVSLAPEFLFTGTSGKVKEKGRPRLQCHLKHVRLTSWHLCLDPCHFKYLS